MDIIKSSADISHLFQCGSRLHTKYLSFIYLPRTRESYDSEKQHDRAGRVAFVAGKKNGNAVWRNSAKRRLRALCREIGGPWCDFDVVMVAKSNLTTSNYQEVKNACEKALTRSELGTACFNE